MTRRARWLALPAAAAALAVTTPAAGANPPHITVPLIPACTQTALQAGLSRGYATQSAAKVVRPFGCSGRWAFAAVTTPRFEATAVFHDRDGRWITVRRGPACASHAIPQRLYRPACLSN
jgi:hypothetical protein